MINVFLVSKYTDHKMGTFFRYRKFEASPYHEKAALLKYVLTSSTQLCGDDNGGTTTMRPLMVFFTKTEKQAKYGVEFML